jgi:tRNA-specific 2-thiouridylase
MALNNNKKVPKTVYVGMSGGVDSSVSAALLKTAGYKVVGVFIKPWDPADDPETDWGIACNWRVERREAMRAAAHLDIPLITLDASGEYKEKVVDYLLSEYRAGRTPNPDVMCNKQIKFGIFYNWAIAQGANFVATGHYCQLKAQSLKRKTKDFKLVVSKDKNKDQTYFLWNLKKEQLPHILFPVGGYEKEEVRKLAKKFGLPNAKKKDSQGLCFIGQIDFKKFLSGQIPLQTGAVLNEAGEIIGHHDGAIFLTIGERRGFVVEKKTPDQKPYFVIAKDVKKNTVTVSSEPNKTKKMNAIFEINEINWINEVPRVGQKYQARFRYRQPLQTGQFTKVTQEEAVFCFDESQLKPSGQSLVIYDGDVCLGGGAIR